MRDERLSGRVHLLGAWAHARIEQLLRAADFLVSGSHIEGSGYAVIEALACGTSPLVTDIPSFRKLTRNGEVGGLVPVGDAAAMAERVVEWSARPRDPLRRAARQHFERELSFAVLGTRLRDAYMALGGQ
jgi:glycosyltransferase involved in cell wall biosynthesis